MQGTHATGRDLSSVEKVLLVGFAVHGPGRLLLRPSVIHDAGELLIVAVRGVLYQFLLAELKPLGLATSRLFHGKALLAAALG
jgi:hypothetical protein